MSEAASPVRSSNIPESVALINLPNNQPQEPDDNDSGLDTGYDERITHRSIGGPNHLNVVHRTPAFVKNCCPPRGRFGEYATRIIACIVIWAALYCVVGSSAWVGGNLFSLYLLLVLASLGGFLVGWKTRYFNFPALLGMLIVGFLLKNIEAINIAKNIDSNWSSSLRQVALAVILLRSGLGLDIAALKRLRFTVLRLAFGPCITEAVTVAVMAHFLLGLPWLWAFQLGFIIGAVSPAVVVPSMLTLQLDGYGVEEGIPTLVMAASSCDDVLAISLFGVFLGVSFSEGNLLWNIFRGPLEIAMGIIGGLLIGSLLWYFPWKKAGNATANRSVLLLAFAFLFLFGSNQVNFPGAGALGVLCLGATTGYGWGEKEKVPIERVMGILWDIFQPLLFGLIGAEVSIQYLKPDLVGMGLAALGIGLVLRIGVTYFAVMGNSFSTKEKLFCTIAWLPKATVQAAIGSIPLDKARQVASKDPTDANNQAVEYGIQIVTLAVLAILITAPLGAIGISLTGPRFLSQRKNEELGEPEANDESDA